MFLGFLDVLLMMFAPEVAVLLTVPKVALMRAEPLLVEGLGVGGGGRDHRSFKLTERGEYLKD